MFVEIPFDKVQNTGVRGKAKNNKKARSFPMIVGVTAENIEEAVTKLKESKGVLAFSFEGDPTTLANKEFETSKLILYKKDIEQVDSGIDLTVHNIDKRLTQVYMLPENYNDMRTIYEYNIKYPNIRFCGGDFLHIEGCNLGVINANDLTRKTPKNRMPIRTKGCASVQRILTLDEIEEVEFYQAQGEKKAAPKKKEPKKKKAQTAPTTPTKSVTEKKVTNDKPKQKKEPIKPTKPKVKDPIASGLLDNF